MVVEVVLLDDDEVVPRKESDLTTPSFPGRLGRIKRGSGCAHDRHGKMARGGTTCKFNFVAVVAALLSTASSAAALARIIGRVDFITVVVFDDNETDDRDEWRRMMLLR